MTSPSLNHAAISLLDTILTDSPQWDPRDSAGTCFHNFFLAKEDSIVLKEIPTGNVDPSRHKRPHHKSRRGCSNCRKRRVKCDEKTPRCSHCLRRDEECERRAFDIRQTHSPQPDMLQQIPPPPLLGGTSPAVNMLHMKLFHHFETSTRHTLCFGSVWKEALGWSLEYEALMQAILCVSARHLAYLCPDEPGYGVAAASHLAQTLSIFRKDINQKFTASNVDFFMATSVLIYFELWTETEFLVTDSAGLTALDLSKDTIFRLAGGLVEIFMRSGPVMYEKPSSFIVDIMHSPRQVLNSAARLSKETLASFHSFFSYSQPLRYEQLSVASAFKGDSTPEPSEWMAGQTSEEEVNFLAAHKDVVSRLTTLLLFLPEVQGPEFLEASEQLMPDLTRYAFTFLIMIHAYAEKIISRQDPKGLLMLYHFYRAVRILLGGPNCWWSHKRARLLEPLLEERLQNQLNRAL
ncbi:hypothetical protein G7Y89_g1485 [Cudoniella acicularis]|uniref:Zn(2)-C6 fungal-type domain-containing protein n=1 Tax=Cudoniella acicularis TaxID=354080 RepID=A0A8H4RWT5_9HELO|nr:hypothetical protein G7Y89_g1485 [Cudoniella acicularis]